jgi:predicted nucleic acid-binding protein
LLLDTNILSEMMKGKDEQNPQFKQWANNHSIEHLKICTFSLAEIYWGIYKLDEGAKRTRLYSAVKRLEQEFTGQILGFDADCAENYGRIRNKAQKQGLAMDAADALFLAVAERFNLSIVTRNQKHFEGRTELALLNPFDS